MPTSPSQFLMTTPDKGILVPPLDVEKFNGSFEYFRSVKRLAVDRELLSVGRGEVNLHSLHVEVMRNRGYDTREVRW